eukprot:Seg3367.2 transcript_id=Seg3367.2/GoldUCD/mRNA.D3Y31 product="Ferric-chelate reductase 1" protein_id=Seg3367.2/GoldUCD/D3Y31
MGFLINIMVIIALAFAVEATSLPKPSLDCGKGFGCFSWPPNCKPSSCIVFIQFFYYKPPNMSIAISALVDGWVAFGLNEQPAMMGGTVGEVCMLGKNNQVILKGFENKDTDFDKKDLNSTRTQFLYVYGFYVNKRLTCTYTRPVKGGKLRDMSQPWYLIASWGQVKMKDSGPHPREHKTGDYFWSKKKITMTKENVVVGVNTYGWDLIAVHGSLMIIAWIGLAFSGMFYARYMRQVWQNKLKGSAFWFQLHRGMMIGSGVFTVIAFIVILVEVKGWNTEMGAHPILGIIVIVLSAIQAIAGMLRPGIGSPRRFIFNMAHRCNGVVAFILAMITIFLGLAAMDVDIVIMIVYLIVIVVIVLGIEVNTFYKSRTVTEVQYRESELNSTEMESSDDEGPQVFSTKEVFIRKCLSALVTGVGIGFSIIMISLVAHKGYVYSKKGLTS